MGQIGNDLEKHKASHFGFSATRLQNLLSTEYTLVTIVADRSGSTLGFTADMEAVLKEIIAACSKSPRADNLLVRLVVFATKHVEIHGFKLLSQINIDDYNGVLAAGGNTALFDASVDAIEASNAFGKKLLSEDYSVNGIVFLMTDGADNNSANTVQQVKQGLEQAVSGENMESMVSVLIGVNVQEPSMKNYLETLNQDAGFSQYVELPDANKKTLARLAQFVSKSISSQSQSLGSGGPSASIVF